MTLLGLFAGIVWINVLKLQDVTLSNYEKITDTGTSDYHNNSVLPTIAALFYQEDVAKSGFKKREQIYEKKDLKLMILPTSINMFTGKIYDNLADKEDITEVLLVYANQIYLDNHLKLVKRKFPSANITSLQLESDKKSQKTEVESYLDENNKIVVFLADLNDEFDNEDDERLINSAVSLAKKYDYKMKVFNIADEYSVYAMQGDSEYNYSVENTLDNLSKQKENLDSFVMHNRKDILYYFKLNMQELLKHKPIKVPEKNTENYRLFDRGAVYVRVFDETNSQIFEELKLNQDEGIIAIIANIAKHIVNLNKQYVGKYFHLYLLTDMEQISNKSEDMILNYLEPDDGIYIAHQNQAGLLTAADRPDDGKELIAKLRSVAQINNNVKTDDLLLYRFKYTEIQYEN